jgi:hypothetical protein
MYCVNEAAGNKKMAQKATVPIIKIPGECLDGKKGHLKKTEPWKCVLGKVSTLCDHKITRPSLSLPSHAS